MLSKCLEHFDESNIIILSAAVADYAPAMVADRKIKREGIEDMTIRLVRNPDIAASLGKRKKSGQIMIGFALETDNEFENAVKKLHKKNLDWIVLNSLKDPEAGFMKDTNKITMLSVNGDKIPFDAKSKTLVANDIMDTISV